MLTERDVVVLKLALERGVLDASAYVKVLELLQRGERLGLSMRSAGVAGDVVGDLVSAADLQATTGAVLTRCDAENTLMRRFLQSSGVRPGQLEEADRELGQLAQAGQFCSVDEVFVNRGWLPLMTAVALRKRVKERLATCSGCWRHFLLQPDTRKVRCPACRRVVRAGEGTSATDACRQLLTESQQAAEGQRPSVPPTRPPSHPSGVHALGQQPAPPGSAALRTTPRTGAHPAPVRATAASSDSLGGNPYGSPRVPPPVPAPSLTATGRLQAAPPQQAPPQPPAPPPPQPPGKAAAKLTSARFGAPSKTGSTEAPASIPLEEPATGHAPPPRRDPASNRLARLPEVKLPGIQGVPGPAETATGSSHGDDVDYASDFDESSIVETDLLTSEDAVARFDKYEIVAEVARGAMGIVYKARRAGSDRPLALKVLMAGERATPKQVARFEREAEAARRFQHPGIVRIEETGAHQGYHYIVMEFVEGDTLERRLKDQGPFDPLEAAQVVAQVADAVACIHAGDVVHRDLKPGNIIIKAGQHPKLIDFGLAKVVQEEKLTRTGVMVGTPFYMAPEQVKGTGDVGPASDVYALGSILYELVAGRPPFVGQNYGELFAAIVNTQPPAPSSLRPEVPAALDAIILRCIAKEQHDRYPTARALKEDLDRLQAGARTEAARKGTTDRAARVLRRVAAVAAVLLLVGAVALGGHHLLRRDSTAQVQRLHDEARAAMREGNHAAAGRALTAARTLDPARPDLAALLGRCLIATGEVDAGFAQLEEAVSLGWRDAGLLETPELQAVKGEARLEALERSLRR